MGRSVEVRGDKNGLFTGKSDLPFRYTRSQRLSNDSMSRDKCLARIVNVSVGVSNFRSFLAIRGNSTNWLARFIVYFQGFDERPTIQFSDTDQAKLSDIGLWKTRPSTEFTGINNHYNLYIYT